MEYCNGRLCVSTRELFDGGIVTEANYRNWTNRNRVDVVRRGGGARGSYALIAVDSLPRKYASKLKSINLKSPFISWFESNYKFNLNAIEYFGDRRVCGFDLKYDKALNYTVNASILDLLLKMISSKKLVMELFDGKIQWATICGFLKFNKDKYNHSLPTSYLRLKMKLNSYRKAGYKSLISGRFGNTNAQKR